jgi:hypothetical protein
MVLLVVRLLIRDDGTKGEAASTATPALNHWHAQIDPRGDDARSFIARESRGSHARSL